MSDERPFDPDTTAPVAVADDSPNGTGEHPADSIESIESTDATAAATEPAEASDASALEGAAEADAEATEPAEADSVAAAAPGFDFVSRLVRAMQTTAGVERARVGEQIDRQRAEQVAAIQTRRDEEQARMRDLAADDRRAIDSWADAEHRRINAEHSRRTKELEADLSRSLEEHGRQVDTRIGAVEAAVSAHRTDVDAFFASLDSETDPVRIAQRIADRPTFPDLDAALEPATTSETDAAAVVEADGATAPETPLVPVMDPISRLGLLRASPDPFERQVTGPAPSAEPAGAYIPSSDGEAGRPDVLSPVAARTSGRPDEATAQTHPSSKPMGWLRRNHDQGDQS